MARPKKPSEPRVPVYVRLHENLVDRLDAEAERRDVSRNFLVTRALERYLHDVETKEVP